MAFLVDHLSSASRSRWKVARRGRAAKDRGKGEGSAGQIRGRARTIDCESGLRLRGAFGERELSGSA
eukprot:1322688-Pyramimonas_sp.AAC.1